MRPEKRKARSGPRSLKRSMRGAASCARRVKRSGAIAHSRTRSTNDAGVETLANVAPVEPIELCNVEDRAADRDVFDLETPHDRREIHQLVLALVRRVREQR